MKSKINLILSKKKKKQNSQKKTFIVKPKRKISFIEEYTGRPCYA
jgi:hypothetical protein